MLAVNQTKKYLVLRIKYLRMSNLVNGICKLDYEIAISKEFCQKLLLDARPNAKRPGCYYLTNRYIDEFSKAISLQEGAAVELKATNGVIYPQKKRLTRVLSASQLFALVVIKSTQKLANMRLKSRITH